MAAFLGFFCFFLSAEAPVPPAAAESADVPVSPEISEPSKDPFPDETPESADALCPAELPIPLASGEPFWSFPVSFLCRQPVQRCFAARYSLVSRGWKWNLRNAISMTNHNTAVRSSHFVSSNLSLVSLFLCFQKFSSEESSLPYRSTKLVKAAVPMSNLYSSEYCTAMAVVTALVMLPSSSLRTLKL